MDQRFYYLYNIDKNDFYFLGQGTWINVFGDLENKFKIENLYKSTYDLFLSLIKHKFITTKDHIPIGVFFDLSIHIYIWCKKDTIKFKAKQNCQPHSFKNNVDKFVERYTKTYIGNYLNSLSTKEKIKMSVELQKEIFNEL